MKKALLWMFAIVGMIATTSCDDDVDKAMVLSGEWRGDFGMSYDYKGYTYDSYDTYLEFVPDYDYAKHGYGIQVDYYQYGPYERQWYRFNWEVKNGVIYMEYPYDRNLNTEIVEYKMTNDYLAGKIGNTRFHLDKLTDYYDWTPYVNTHGYYTNSHYYAPAMRSVISDDAQGEMPKENEIHRFNRFKK